MTFPSHIEIEEYRKNNKIEEEINQNTTEKGNGYEYHIEKLLEKVNYKVEDRKSGSGDGGIDIIARDNEFTWIIQCKNFKNDNNKVTKVSPKDIQALHGSVDVYKRKNNNEKVAGAFFSNSGFSEQSQKDAEILNITLRHIELYNKTPQQLRM